jgi:hydroxymethylpyrimidine pyrophosphatase-like HAD family hydrolase
MIVASDLDRTLVYSKRALNELGCSPQIPLIPVEKKDGNWVAFMTERAFNALSDLCKYHLFIPVTTRTTEQFNRFELFNHGNFPLTYAITLNGAEILYKGKTLHEWTRYMTSKIQNESITQITLLSILNKEGYQFDGKIRQVDNLFFYYILNKPPSPEVKAALQNFVAEYGWRISLQGRKLYFIPTAISKGAALEFICRREGMEAFAGAGDSLLDLDFLQNCRYQFVPRHGELANEIKGTKVTMTNNAGVAAGEEILLGFLTLLKSKNISYF